MTLKTKKLLMLSCVAGLGIGIGTALMGWGWKQGVIYWYWELLGIYLAAYILKE
jgi:hypothetical protein